MPRPILCVDDDPLVLRAASRMLEAEGHTVICASSGAEALAVLERDAVALLVTDISMPGMSGIELLEKLKELDEAPPAIVVSGEGSIDMVVRAIQLGALDYLTKPVQRERLTLTVANALRFQRLADAHELLRADVGATSIIIGKSPAMERVRSLVAKVAPSEGRVLILGENGSGKEVVAAAIHAGSGRSAGPFVNLNCAAVPESLVESELFGHEKGAFTGAVSARRGRFELADGGTLFLDEVGDMSPSMQAKMLRVLQEGCFERVGGGRTIKVDVRVIAATNCDIEALVEDGRFREDLYYRLAVVTIEVPPLRDRAEDIDELVEHFLRAAAPRNGRPRLTLTPDALALLRRYRFAGNVRELSNMVERLAILAASDEAGVDDIELILPQRRRGAKKSESPYREGVPLKDLLRDAERAILEGAIATHGDSKPDAAKALEVERSHFYKKCRQLGIA